MRGIYCIFVLSNLWLRYILKVAEKGIDSETVRM